MRDMIPYLKDGNWDAGMVAGVRAVCGRLDGSMVNDGEDEDELSFFGILAAVIGFFVVAGLIGWIAARAASKCPNCGQHKLQRTGSKVVSRRNGVKTEDVTYTCRNCGHSIVRRKHLTMKTIVEAAEAVRSSSEGAEASAAEAEEDSAEAASEEVWEAAEAPVHDFNI